MRPFSTPVKTSESRKVFWCFQGVEKGCIGNECVKEPKIKSDKENLIICNKKLEGTVLHYAMNLPPNF